MTASTLQWSAILSNNVPPERQLPALADYHRSLLQLQPSVAVLGAVMVAVFLSGMCLGAVLFWWYSQWPSHSPSSCVETVGSASPRQRSSFSIPAKPVLKLPVRPKRKGDIEESVMDVYTTTDDDNDSDDRDESRNTTTSPRGVDHTTTSVPQPREQYQESPEHSFLTEIPLADEPSRERIGSRDYSYYGGDEVSMAGYSLSAATDGPTVVKMPASFCKSNQERRTSTGSVMVASIITRQQQSSKTLPLVGVQRKIQAPPGRLGIMIHVTNDGPKVQQIKTLSPLEGHLFVGDIVMAINNTDIRSLNSLSAIHKVLEETNGIPRTLTVVTMDDVTKKTIGHQATRALE